MNANPEKPSPAEHERLFNQFVELQQETVRGIFKAMSKLDQVGQDEVWNEVLTELWLRWSKTDALSGLPIDNLVGYWLVSLKNRACTYRIRRAKRKCVSLPQDGFFPCHHASDRLGSSLEVGEVCLRFFTELTDLQSQIFRLHAVERFSIRKLVACRLHDGDGILTKHGVVKQLKEIEAKALKFRARYL